jgi:hypothetical protein
MSYEFTRLGAVEALTEMPENANALVEVNGAIKRVPGNEIGSGLFVINLVKGEQMEESPIPQYPTAFAVEIDKTFAEVLEAFRAGNRVECRESAEDGSIMIYQPIGFGETTCGFSSRIMSLDFVVMIAPDGTAYMVTND